MRIQFYLFFLVCFWWAGCSSNNHQQDESNFSTDELSKAGATTQGNFTAPTDTLIINQRTAIFYEPDSVQIEAQREKVGEETFYIGADDYLFYLSTAHEYVEKQRLPVIRAQNQKYLMFVGAEKTTLIKRDTLPELWGFFFFDPAKAPARIDLTMIEEEYKSYFP